MQHRTGSELADMLQDLTVVNGLKAPILEFRGIGNLSRATVTFSKSDWRDIDLSVIIRYPADCFELTEYGFRYFFPAILTACLKECELTKTERGDLSSWLEDMVSKSASPFSLALGSHLEPIISAKQANLYLDIGNYLDEQQYTTNLYSAIETQLLEKPHVA